MADDAEVWNQVDAVEDETAGCYFGYHDLLSFQLCDFFGYPLDCPGVRWLVDQVGYPFKVLEACDLESLKVSEGDELLNEVGLVVFGLVPEILFVGPLKAWIKPVVVSVLC